MGAGDQTRIAELESLLQDANRRLQERLDLVDRLRVERDACMEAANAYKLKYEGLLEAAANQFLWRGK